MKVVRKLDKKVILENAKQVVPFTKKRKDFGIRDVEVSKVCNFGTENFIVNEKVLVMNVVNFRENIYEKVVERAGFLVVEDVNQVL